ncbi:hypothetical protein [Heyndrickxia ginsengihumi]|uniref:hypothetical protein n=1 Tax=Heyndrickxia ginsengihumi TaxID=363870 RepID=UPI000470CE0E|nr:hypothetical protein [Heyndrickxia ginsengihumi]
MFGNIVDFSVSPVGSILIIEGAILAVVGIIVLIIGSITDIDILKILGIAAFLLGSSLYTYGVKKLTNDITNEHNYNAVKQEIIEKESEKESLFFDPKCKAKNKLEMRYQKCFSIQKRLKIKSLPG